jgi:predicted AlkP superfamily pyrophosphatase or phosphodiesterase
MGERGDARDRTARAGAPWRVALVSLALLLLLVSAAPAFAGDPIVILLSWDGVRHDYPDRGSLPSLARMARDGARAERLVPPFPSVTFPSHVTLATGAPVDRHGIVANSFLDRDGRRFHYGNDASWILAEPLWVTAERQGVHAATYFWVGSETAWQGVAATHHEAPFDESVTEDAKVDRILAWLDLPAAERPRLVMSWWHGADAAGHRHGPRSSEVDEAMQGEDAALARLLAGLDARGLWPDATLLVVSDHGMTDVGESVDLAALLREAGVEARVVSAGPVAHLWLADPARRDDAIRVATALPGVRAWPSDALPAALRYGPPSRLGDVVVVTDPPRLFAPESTIEGVTAAVLHLFGWRQGSHGYDPSLPDMGGVFFALGRGVPAGTRLGVVRSMDVAPTVARLLGIAPPRDAEGVPIAGLASGAPAEAAR